MSQQPSSLIAALGADFAEAFAQDKDAENAGVWFDLPGVAGKRVKYRSHHANRPQDAWVRIQKRHNALYAAKKFPPAEDRLADQITHLTNDLAVDWEGFPVPFSKAAHRELCEHSTPYVDWAWAKVTDRAEFRPTLTPDEQADVEGNSAPSSGTP